MSDRKSRLAKGIKAFVDHPVTNLIKGAVLLLIGISDASETFRDDLKHGQLRMGHGFMIIGVFSILGALPHLIDSMEAWVRYLELREQKHETKTGSGEH